MTPPLGSLACAGGVVVASVENKATAEGRVDFAVVARRAQREDALTREARRENIVALLVCCLLER